MLLLLLDIYYTQSVQHKMIHVNIYKNYFGFIVAYSIIDFTR